MAYKVIMPKAGMAMETGKIVKWLKNEGDPVDAGEPLLEIETDKVNMEVEAMNAGFLLKILAHEGDEIPVVQTIGYIGKKGEAVPRGEETQGQETGGADSVEKQQKPVPKAEVLRNEGAGIAATPAARRVAKEKGIDLKGVVPSGSRGQIKAADVIKTLAKATPLAKAMAADVGVDMAGITGTGFAGKITKADVMAAAKPAEHKHAAEQKLGSDEDTLVPHTGMRNVIAARMLQSHLEIPSVTQSCVADVTELFALRKKINTGETRISVNDFIIMAVTKTLKEQPRINASYTDEGLLIKKHINIGVAVALPEGLIVPVIKNADKLTLSGISAEAKALAGKAKAGKLAPDEYTGGTFTISNLGMMGVTSFTPIINQPEIAILGVCAAQQKLEMDENGNVVKRMKMGLSLTYDHRCIDGAQAAIFSNRIVALLENPVSMFV